MSEFKKFEDLTPEEQILVEEVCIEYNKTNTNFEYWEKNGVRQKNMGGQDVCRPLEITYEKNEDIIIEKHTYEFPIWHKKSGLNEITFKIN